MPPRDDHEFEQKRRQIIDGALAVFSEMGFEKATNKDIARAAGIRSPGLIYHYFESKTDLLRQVVFSRSLELQLLVKDEALLQMPPREALSLIGTAMLDTLGAEDNLAFLRVLLSEAIRRPAVAEIWNVNGPMLGFQAIARYLRTQMQAGTLRPMDVGAAVRCFFGPFISFILMRDVFPQEDARTLSRQTMVATAVETFLCGMETRQDAPGATRSPGSDANGG